MDHKVEDLSFKKKRHFLSGAFFMLLAVNVIVNLDFVENYFKPTYEATQSIQASEMCGSNYAYEKACPPVALNISFHTLGLLPSTGFENLNFKALINSNLHFLKNTELNLNKIIFKKLYFAHLLMSETTGLSPPLV